MTDKIYKDSVGVLLTIRTGADLTGATVTIQVKKRSSGKADSLATWTPAISDPPTDGILTYTTVAGDLDQAGDYILQPRITLPGGVIGKCDSRTWRIYGDFE